MSEQIRVTVTVDTDELRKWADHHADAGNHGVAHVLYKAATDGESLSEQHAAEIRRAAGERVARAIETERPEMGLHINVTDYRRGMDDGLIKAARIARGESA